MSKMYKVVHGAPYLKGLTGTLISETETTVTLIMTWCEFDNWERMVGTFDKGDVEEVRKC